MFQKQQIRVTNRWHKIFEKLHVCGSCSRARLHYVGTGLPPLWSPLHDRYRSRSHHCAAAGARAPCGGAHNLALVGRTACAPAPGRRFLLRIMVLGIEQGCSYRGSRSRWIGRRRQAAAGGRAEEANRGERSERDPVSPQPDMGFIAKCWIAINSRHIN